VSCPKDRFATTPDGEPGLHYLCPGYQDFFRHVREPMQAMSALLRTGQAPAGLMTRYAAEDSRRGRNDPCPCRSGRKWKRCHGGEPAR
jgi:serine-type anaerobic sulfatase-maturating enzyme